MAVKRVLSRLLRLRELEEELSRMDLETAVSERNRVEREMESIRSWQARGRRSFAAEVQERETLGRSAALVQIEQARALGTRSAQRLAAADAEVARQRQEFLERRTGRQQVETLLDGARSEAEVEAGRRAQQMLDDWFGRKERRENPRPIPRVSQQSGTEAGKEDFAKDSVAFPESVS